MPVLAAVAVLLAASEGCQVNRRTPDDTLVMVVDSVIRDLDPRFALTNHDVKLSRLVAPGLSTVDTESMEPVPYLAESITEIDDLTWEVVLRDELVFSSGEPVTSADVEYTFESVLDPQIGSLYRKNFAERFRDLEVTGDRTVRLHLQQPLATLLSDLDFGIVSKEAALDGGGLFCILGDRLGRPIEADGEMLCRRGLFRDGRVVGAGPFMVTSYDEEDVRLERNPRFWGEPAKIDKLRVRTVRDSNARNLMLVGGSADFAQNSVRVDLVDYVLARDRIEGISGESAILSYLMMHNEDPILGDVRVRRAIAHALDREGIIESKFGGRAVAATGLLAPMHWAYRGEVDRYPHDPKRARDLLDEAGYPDPDGPGGEPRMTLTYKTSADQFRVAIARVIAAQLGEVGIEVDVRSFEFGTFFSDVKKGNYQLASMQTSAIAEPDFYYTYFHSSRIPTEANPHTHNRWRYRNARVDELTSLGRRVADRERRRAIYGEVQEILARELPIVPLWHENNIALVNRDVEGFEVLPTARYGRVVQVTKDGATGN